MWMLILMIISALIFGALIFGTKVQTKTRSRNTEYWSKVPWVDAGKPKVTRLNLVLATIACLIPIVNIILAIIIIIIFCKQLPAPDWDCGTALVHKRIVLKNPITDWLMEEI